MGAIIQGFIGVIVILWLAWFFTGGPAKYEREQSGPYIEPIAPNNPAKTYGDPNTGYKDYFKQ